MLAEGEAELRAGNLQAAVNAFHQAAALAQARESTLADITASVGLARVLLGRRLWEEAASALQEAMPRLRSAGDVAGQITASLSLALARERLVELLPARDAAASALRSARAVGYSLLEAEALGAEGRLLGRAAEYDASSGRYVEALALVEGVGAGVKDVGARATYFDDHAELYAAAIVALAITDAPRNSATVAEFYATAATVAGRAAVVQELDVQFRLWTAEIPGHRDESGRRVWDERAARLETARQILTH